LTNIEGLMGKAQALIEALKKEGLDMHILLAGKIPKATGT